MKLLWILIFSAAACAQGRSTSVNLQLHRDFNREIFTSTVEILELDRYGSLFLFTDFDYGRTGQQGQYFEVSRSHNLLAIGQAELGVSLQYNDGVLPYDGPDGKGIPRTVLGGVTLANIVWGKANFELQALARQEFAAKMGWQLTGVWFCALGGTPLEFLGSVDWNSNYSYDGPNSVQAEPQFQFHKGAWAVGTEVEISRNFPGAYTEKHGFDYGKWYVHPTIYGRFYL